MTDDEKSPPAPPDPGHKDETLPPTPDLTELTRQGMEKMQAALSNYLTSFASAARGEAESTNEVTSAFAKYAGRNVANAVAFAQKLAQVRDVQDLVKIQTEFFKSQMEAAVEQTAVVRESAEKASAERLERIAALAEQVFGDRVKARRWLRRPRRSLHGKTVLTFVTSESGAQFVEEMLRRMQERPAGEPPAASPSSGD
ncbi:MAG: antitoxin Xre/MbcA/ParS toxin-binding domain-containing protein [Xanthobacteraceae bacterium]